MGGSIKLALPVKMPQKGLSEESCVITKWHKKKGDEVKTGDILFTIETGKSTFDVEAEADGTLIGVFFDEGDEVPVSTYVCVIGDSKESTDEFSPHKYDTVKEETQEQKNKRDNIRISPRAKILSQKSGVDCRYANPTGPNGRIIERDISSLIEKGPLITPSAKLEYLSSDIRKPVIGTGIGGRITTSDLTSDLHDHDHDYEEVKLSNMRRIIADNMYNSLSSTAQLTLNTSFDATDILSYRKKVKEAKDSLGLEDISLSNIILFALSRTLLNHKPLNAHFADDRLLLFKNVHLGIAVDTERGLMVPTIFDANLKSLNTISKESKYLYDRCRTGSIDPQYLKGASFTMTNLGSLGIESFTPVLNPPQTGILGVNSIVEKVKSINGEHVYYPSMGLSLTFDHRALDGAPAARFLKELKNNLENFSVLLAR